jgi:protocatechuate 3,4-dioxygenase beta subunit
LAAEVTVATKLDEQPLARNVELAQGIMVHGHVTDSRTGKPVSGYVKYFAFNNNPHVSENREFAGAHIDFYYRSDNDDEYTIPVLPGSGILTFNANRGGRYPRGVGADEIDGPKSVTNATFFLTSPFLVNANNFNLLKGLDLKPETEEHKLDLVLASGSTFTVKLNAADGQPLSNYYVFGQYNWAGWYEGPKEQTLSVYAYLPEEGRRVMIYHPERNLVGLADITGEASPKQEIALRPGGTIRGRVIDGDGTPLEGLALYAKVRDFYGKNENSPATLKDRGEFPNQLDGQQILTDKDGRFELRGLIPGLKYTVGVSGIDTMNGRRYTADRGLIFTDETIQAGQTKDLGDLRVKPIIADQKQLQAAQTKAAQSTDVAGPKADQQFTFAGSVIDHRGQPMAAASISFGYLHEKSAGTGPRLLATTDQAGKFQFTKRRSELTGADGEAALVDAELIATKAGYGFAASAVQYFESSGSLLAELGEQDKTTIEYNHGKPSSLLTLVPDDVPIRGRLLDSEGRAVAGAKIEVATVWRGKNGDLNDWEAAASQPGADEAATGQFVRPLSFSGYLMTGDYPLAASHVLVVPPVRTDANGRFVLSGVGRDRLVQLYISGPGMATMRIDARSRRGDVLRLPNRVSYPEFGDITYYPADFTCIASPSVAVTGRLTDRATGHPVAGCVIRGEKIATSPIHGGLEAMYIHAKTDADGHYRLEGLPLGDSIVQIVPPPASSYLIANVDVKTSPSSTPQVRDVALSSGVKVRGRVTDARTGKPLSGRLAYFAFVTNPHLQTATGFDSPEFHYRSGADGRYEIPVLPGKGILAFMADNHHDYRRGVGADRIDGPKYDRPNDLLFRTEPSLCHPFNHHLLVSLDPAPDATSVDLDLSLTSGLSFTGRVRRADGQPIGKYYLYGEQAFASWHTPRSGETFEVKGYFPDEGRRLMVYHPEHNLVGWVDVTDAPPNNLEIVLRKGGVLTGRVVDADGLPLEGISLDSDWRDLKIASRYSPAVAKTWGEPITSLEGRQLLTDKEGRFELKGVIPGLQYSVRAGGTTRQFGRMQATVLGGLFTDVTANSGQIKDLGDLRIKEREVKGPAEAKADADAGREPAPAGDKASKDAEKTASSEGKPAANAATDKAKTTKPSTPAAATEFRGRIVDASSNAVSGAKIYAILSRLPDLEPLPPRLIATTNAAGEFNLALPIAPAVDPKERLGWMARERLVITAPGHGFVLTSLDQLRNQPPAAGLLGSLANAIAGGGTPTISLPKAGERIRGRLVDIDGQPVVGATVKTRWYDEIKSTGAWSRNPETKNDEKAAWQERVNHLLNVIEPVQYRDVLPEATTDAAGRFELRDLGANRLFQLLVQGERIESIELVARNQPGDEIVIPPERNYRDHEVTLYPREFTRAVGPSTPVTGRVVDFDTGEPIAGAVVRAYAIHGSRLHSSREREEFATRSSADGSYKITGLPIGKENRLAAFTLGDIPYIPVGCQADTSKPDGNRQDFRLKRGVFAEGRVYDGQTDKPFTGEIRYYWFRDRKLEQEFPGLFYAMVDERYWTNGLGEFRVPVLPARGVLAFRYSGHDRDRDGIDRFPRGGGADAIGGAEAMGSLNAFPTLPHYLMPTDYERVAEVNPQADQKTVHVDLPLYASQPVKVRVLDAEGNPVTGCEIYGANQRWGWQPKSDAEFSIEDLKADERRKVLAFHRSRNLAGGAIAKRDAEQPIEIKLAPAGTISGRLIDADGLPITDAEVHADYDKLKSGDMSGLWANHPRLISNPTHIPTDKDGRFQVEGLIPGWTYNAYATAPRKLNGQSYNSVVIGRVFKAVRIEPGENKDLGDIRVEQEKDEEPEKEKRVENTPAASSKPAPAASRAGTSAANGSAIAGRVTDAAGKPIAGAQIAAIARRSTPARGGNLQYDGEVLCEASTDDKGEYNLRLKGVSSKTHRYGSLIARAGDLAVAWKKLDLDSPQTEASFNLVQDEPIRGRLIDIEGRPAANVKFNVRSVIKTVTSGWSEEGAGYRGEKTPAAWLPPITCDSEGRFTIRGVPPGHGVHIDVEPTDLFAPQGISINTGNSESRGENDGTYRALVRNGKLGEEIVLPLSPAQIFEGTIRYEDTKQPAPHARLNIWASQQRMPGSMISVEGKADAEGHYRIHALPGIRFGVTAYPPDGAPYLVRKTDEPIQWETSERVKQVDLTLPRGVLIRGKITAAGRGTPIAGASIQYLPQASKDRRPDRTILTGWQAIEVSGDDGSFQIPVLPGPGWLVVHAGSGSYVLKEAGSSFIDYGKPGGQRYYAHAFHKIDPTAGADALDVTIELQPGASLAGQIVDEQNQPVDEAIVVSRLDIWRTSLYWRGGSPPVLGGRFQLSGLEEGVEYPTHFFDRKRSLGATVHLKAGQPPPTVVLQPCGSAVVRCVDGDGQPVADHHPTLHMVVTPGTHRYDFAGMQAGKLAADSDFITNIYQTHFDQPIPDAAGKLTLPPLIPGATYWILTSKANDGRFEIAREFQVKSGEKLNLGDVVVAKGSSKEGQLSPVKP